MDGDDIVRQDAMSRPLPIDLNPVSLYTATSYGSNRGRPDSDANSETVKNPRTPGAKKLWKSQTSS